MLRKLRAPLRLGLGAQRALPRLSGLPQRSMQLLMVQLHVAGADKQHSPYVRLSAC